MSIVNTISPRVHDSNSLRDSNPIRGSNFHEKVMEVIADAESQAIKKTEVEARKVFCKGEKRLPPEVLSHIDSFLEAPAPPQTLFAQKLAPPPVVVTAALTHLTATSIFRNLGNQSQPPKSLMNRVTISLSPYS